MLGDIASVFTAAGVLGAMFGIWQTYRARIAQFEDRYVDRYWQLLDRLSLDALRGRTTEPQKILESDEQAIRAYFYLCEDELDMRRNGYISDSTYELWRSGITMQLKQPMFAKVWKQVQHETAFPFANLQELAKDPAYDPLKRSKPTRLAKGLTGIRRYKVNPEIMSLDARN